MKQMITNNLGLKLISLVVAFICWLIIINTSDPTTSRKFSDIPVTIINENAITSADRVYEVVDGDRVDVTVKGKRSIVERIRNSHITAKADLSKLSEVNAVAIDVDINLTGVDTSGLVTSLNQAVLRVSLEKRGKENYPVTYRTEGELSSLYVLGDVTIEPPIIEVSGGVSMLKKVKEVSVVIKLNYRTKDFEEVLKPVLYDADGNELNAENITLNTDKIGVKVSVLPSKTIPVYLDVKGTPKEGYRWIGNDLQPKKIRIAGPEALLKDQKSVKIPVNIEGKDKDVENAVDVAVYLPDRIKVVEEYQTVSYRCIIERDGKRTITLTNRDIKFLNMMTNMTGTFLETDRKYRLKISGKEEALKDITAASLAPFLDLDGLGAGVHTVLLQYELPEGVTTKNKIKVKVNLEETIISNENGGIE